MVSLLETSAQNVVEAPRKASRIRFSGFGFSSSGFLNPPLSSWICFRFIWGPGTQRSLFGSYT